MLRKKCNGFKILLIAEFLFLLVLLPGCFQEEKLVYYMAGEDVSDLAIREESSVEFNSERMKLTPGVYRVEVQTQLVDEQSMYVEVKCDTSFFRTLRGNGILTVVENDDFDFEVYVLQEIPTAYVQCVFYGADTDALVRLEICKTGQGNRMLFVIMLLIFSVVDFMICFRKRILEGKVTVRQQVVFWTMTVGILLAYFPYLTDYFFFGEDTPFHLEQIAYVKDLMVQGNIFPVRAQSGWLYEQGYAISLFYGDLFLMIPALLQLTGFSIMASYKLFVLGVIAVTALVAYHSFKRCVKDEYAALFGSMVYLLTPYHIVTIYSRGAVGEYLAMIFLPLICCGGYLLFTEDMTAKDYKKYKWYIILGASGVMQSYLTSMVITIVLGVLACLVFRKKAFRKQTFMQLLEAAAIVWLINAWFWVPLTYSIYCNASVVLSLLQEEMQVLSRWTAFATVFISMFAAFLFKKVKAGQGYLAKAALGIAAVMIVGVAVYYVNTILFEADAVYLYAVENMRSVNVRNGEYLLTEFARFKMN